MNIPVTLPPLVKKNIRDGVDLLLQRIPGGFVASLEGHMNLPSGFSQTPEDALVVLEQILIEREPPNHT